MATKVPQRTPKERLLDANRTPEFAMQLPLSGELHRPCQECKLNSCSSFRLFRLCSFASIAYNRS